MSSAVQLIVTAELMAKARALAVELDQLYQQRVNAGADPIAEAEERHHAFYEGLVAAGMTARDALRTVGRFS